MTIQLSLPPSFAKSWKTSTVGLLSAIYPTVQGFKAFQTGDFKSLLHDPLFYIAILGAVQGWVSKDANVSGGTVAQPSSEEVVNASKVVATK